MRKIKVPIVFLLILFMFLSTIPIKVYAVKTRMTGDSVLSAGVIDGGPYYTRTGWLYYLADRITRKQVSTTIAITTTEDGIKTKNGIKLEKDEKLLTSVFGVKAENVHHATFNPNGSFKSPAWGRPFENDGTAKGDYVSSYLKKQEKDDKGRLLKPNAYRLIKAAWGKQGKEYAKKWESGEYVLVFEPFYWHRVHKNRQPQNTEDSKGRKKQAWICGTAHTIADFQIANGIGTNGDPMIRLYTNGIYATCVRFKEKDYSTLGIRMPTKEEIPLNPDGGIFLSNKNMANRKYGYGMGAVWNKGIINTYNGKDSPGNTEATTYENSSTSIKKGKTVIYKRYWEKKVDEKGETVYEKVKDYKRDNTTHNIIITDEKDKGANYRIIGWFTGKNTKDPQPTEDETLEIKVREIVKTASAGKNLDKDRTQGGSSGAKVELDNKKSEKVLTVIFLKEDGESIIDTYDKEEGSPGNAENPDKDESKQGNKTIVKHYWLKKVEQGKQDKYSHQYRFERKNTTNNIKITDEYKYSKYKIAGWFTGNDKTVANHLKPSEIKKSADYKSARLKGNSAKPKVTLNENESVLTVIYEKEETITTPPKKLGEYNLTESVISLRTGFNENSKLSSILSHSFKWKAPAIKHISCYRNRGAGHKANYRTVCNMYSCWPVFSHWSHPCSGWKWLDKDIIFGVYNKKEKNYPSILSAKNQQVTAGVRDIIIPGTMIEAVKKERSSTDKHEFNIENFNYKFILFRGQDQLTLLKYKNKEFSDLAEGFLGTISEDSRYNFKSADRTNKTRYSNENGYTENFDVNIVSGNNWLARWSYDHYTAYGPTSGSYGMCSKQYSTYNFDYSTSFTATPSVNVDVFWAKENKGLYTGDITTPQWRLYHKQLKAGDINVTPYVWMQYDHKGGQPIKVDVLSEHERKLEVYDYVRYDITNGKTTSSNPDTAIRIDSMQWTNHKRAIDEIEKLHLGDDKANGESVASILPGGATYSYYIPKNDNRVVIITTMQAYLPKDSTGLKQIKKTGGSYDNSLRQDQDYALESHKKLVHEAYKEFEKTSIRQYVKDGGNYNRQLNIMRPKDIIKEYNMALPGQKLNGNKLSTDSKYYFNNYKDSYLNVQYKRKTSSDNIDYEGATERDTFTFYTNTVGEIRCTINNTKPDGNKSDGLLIARKGSSNIIEYPTGKEKEASYIAEKTGIVNTLRKGLISNVGNDSNADWGNEWYNEAFEGVTYLWQRTKFYAGIWNPAERITVQDPRLTPYQHNIADYFKRFHVTALNTFKGNGNHSNNLFGHFKNANNETFTLTYDFRKLYGSKEWYIPNVTTQDLR